LCKKNFQKYTKKYAIFSIFLRLCLRNFENICCLDDGSTVAADVAGALGVLVLVVDRVVAVDAAAVEISAGLAVVEGANPRIAG
jgi:hypothetical protein